MSTDLMFYITFKISYSKNNFPANLLAQYWRTKQQKNTQR